MEVGDGEGGYDAYPPGWCDVGAAGGYFPDGLEDDAESEALVVGDDDAAGGGLVLWCGECGGEAGAGVARRCGVGGACCEAAAGVGAGSWAGRGAGRVSRGCVGAAAAGCEEREDSAFVLAAFFTRASTVALKDNFESAIELLGTLPPRQQNAISSSNLSWRRAEPVELADLPKSRLPDLIELLWDRTSHPDRVAALLNAFNERPNVTLASIVVDSTHLVLGTEASPYRRYFGLARKAFELGGESRYSAFIETAMPEGFAAEVLKAPDDLPSALLLAAVQHVRPPRVRRVATIARQEKWFD